MTFQRIDVFGADGLSQRMETERIDEIVEYRQYDGDLTLVEQRPAVPVEIAAHEAWEYGQTIDEIRTQGMKAINNNKDFLAIENPTQGQYAGQVKALTRQINGVMRTTWQMFDDFDDAEFEE